MVHLTNSQKVVYAYLNTIDKWSGIYFAICLLLDTKAVVPSDVQAAWDVLSSEERKKVAQKLFK